MWTPVPSNLTWARNMDDIELKCITKLLHPAPPRPLPSILSHPVPLGDPV